VPVVQNKLVDVCAYCVIQTAYIKLMQHLWIGLPYFSPTEFYAEVSRFARRFTDKR